MVSWHPLGIKAEHTLLFQPQYRGNGGCRVSTLSNALRTQLLKAHLAQVKRCNYQQEPLWLRLPKVRTATYAGRVPVTNHITGALLSRAGPHKCRAHLPQRTPSMAFN